VRTQEFSEELFMLLIVLTNWLWIPFILYYDIALRRAMKQPD
jgi:hypothetical protein